MTRLERCSSRSECSSPAMRGLAFVNTACGVSCVPGPESLQHRGSISAPDGARRGGYIAINSKISTA